MKKWIAGLVLTIFVLPSSGSAQSKDALVGTWKLLSATDTSDKGERTDAFGQKPVGFLTYTADGRMSVLIANGGRNPLSVDDYIGAPAAERAEAFATFTAYAGTFDVESGRVIHHVQIASLQNRVGTDQVRTIVKLEGDRLILRTPSFLKGGRMVSAELTWQRLKKAAPGP